LNHFQVEAIEIYQCQYKNWFRAAKEEEWEICPSLWQGAMNSYLHIKSFLGQEKNLERLADQKRELEMTQALETEGPVASISYKPAPEVSKNKPKGSQKKQRGLKTHQGKGKDKANWHRPYPQGYRTPKLEHSAMDSVFDMARTLMEFPVKENERRHRTFPHK
ncbi:hypothetical protein O181_066493, partial [Austropuccinia psidii MF-1]|nr:hypothetical protein [Austropuccinia psidii MF-1]